MAPKQLTVGVVHRQVVRPKSRSHSTPHQSRDPSIPVSQYPQIQISNPAPLNTMSTHSTQSINPIHPDNSPHSSHSVYSTHPSYSSQILTQSPRHTTTKKKENHRHTVFSLASLDHSTISQSRPYPAHGPISQRALLALVWAWIDVFRVMRCRVWISIGQFW